MALSSHLGVMLMTGMATAWPGNSGMKKVKRHVYTQESWHIESRQVKLGYIWMIRWTFKIHLTNKRQAKETMWKA